MMESLNSSPFLHKAVFLNIVAFDCIVLVEWSGGHLTPAGDRGKDETPQEQSDEEAQLPPRGMQVSEAQWNGPVLLKTTK